VVRPDDATARTRDGRPLRAWEVAERERLRHRRRHVAADARADAAEIEDGVGLALSGGGIRSATFSLGFLQGMARCRRGGGRVDSDAYRSDPRQDHPDAPGGLLRHVDYLSTVSGGGYTGGFFCSLFVPQRSRGSRPEVPESPCIDEANDAFAAVSAVPGARAVALVEADDPPPLQRAKLVAAPLAWLRQNGRFLAPGGAGDYLYALVLAIRNLFAVHTVLGAMLFAAFLALGLARVAALACPWSRAAAVTVESWFVVAGSPLWWSPWWLVPGVVLAAAATPLGVAYWATQHGDLREGARWLRKPGVLGIVLRLMAAVVFVWLAWHAPRSPITGAAHPALVLAPALFAGAALLSVAWYFAAKIAAMGTVRGMRDEPAEYVDAIRLRLTRWMTASARVALFASLIALVDTAGQTLYGALQNDFVLDELAAGGGATGGLIVLIRWLASRIGRDNVLKGARTLSVDQLGLVLGGLLLLLIATGWATLAQTALWGAGPSPGTVGLAGQIDVGWLGRAHFVTVGEASADPFNAPLAWATVWLVVMLFGIAVMGRTLAFVNLSSLQQLYQSRLARAYFGASNAARFATGTQATSPLEAHPTDSITPDGYWAGDVLAPQHLINVTVNETVIGDDALTQRERKGRLMTLAASGVHVDGVVPRAWSTFVASARLSIPRWIAISGAAFSTGLGRKSSFGASLAAGLANVRTGFWWGCGVDGWQPVGGREGIDAPRTKEAITALLPTQTRLVQELGSRFRGIADTHWYLTDGGHYENLAVLPLLARRLGFILALDNGADPTYRFEDLGNLIRVARIDLGVHLEVLPAPTIADALLAQADAPYAKFFGDEKNFFGQDVRTSECALLYRVHYPETPARPASKGVLMIVKPSLLDGIPLDLREYATRCAEFPQETTADQFFDEAQWESYRRLGQFIAGRLFGERPQFANWYPGDLCPLPRSGPAPGGAAAAAAESMPSEPTPNEATPDEAIPNAPTRSR
jgi:hypothetical protein